MDKIKIGLVQINNSFSNACYFPYSVGLLATYFNKYSLIADEFEFLKPIFKRVSVQSAVNQLKYADIVAFSAYGWNYRLSLEIAY